LLLSRIHASMVHPILKGLGAFRRIAVSEMRRTTFPCPRYVPVATWSGVRPALRTAPQALARENGRRAEFLEEGKVVIKPIATKAQFKKELRGCVEISKIDPLEAKRIWKA